MHGRSWMELGDTATSRLGLRDDAGTSPLGVTSSHRAKPINSPKIPLIYIQLYFTIIYGSRKKIK